MYFNSLHLQYVRVRKFWWKGVFLYVWHTLISHLNCIMGYIKLFGGALFLWEDPSPWLLKLFSNFLPVFLHPDYSIGFKPEFWKKYECILFVNALLIWPIITAVMLRWNIRCTHEVCKQTYSWGPVPYTSVRDNIKIFSIFTV